MHNNLQVNAWLTYILSYRNSLPNDKMLDLSKLKAFADNRLTHSHTMIPFDAPGKQASWTHLDNFLPFSSNLKLLSANFFSLEESKICRLVMG